jgi:hypothetical protein
MAPLVELWPEMGSADEFGCQFFLQRYLLSPSLELCVAHYGSGPSSPSSEIPQKAPWERCFCTHTDISLQIQALCMVVLEFMDEDPSGKPLV